MCHDCLEVGSAREVDEKVEDCLESEPDFQHTWDTERKMERPADQRIEHAKRCNEVQDKYACSNENVVLGGYTYHGEGRYITAIGEA
jgi:hypothetical protein